MCFQGSFNRKEDTQTVNVNTAVVIISGDMTCQRFVMWQLANLSETDIFRMSPEWLLPGTAN